MSCDPHCPLGSMIDDLYSTGHSGIITAVVVVVVVVVVV